MMDWDNTNIIIVSNTKTVTEKEFQTALRRARSRQYIEVRCDRCGIITPLSQTVRKHHQNLCLNCLDDEQ